MKKIVMLMAAMMAFGANAASQEVVGDVIVTYTVNGGEAQVGAGDRWPTAIPSSTIGGLSIPDTLGDCPVTSIGAGAFASCSGLESVVLPEGVMSIGDFAFTFCFGLESVVIPDSVMNIGDWAFYCIFSPYLRNNLTELRNRARATPA